MNDEHAHKRVKAIKVKKPMHYHKEKGSAFAIPNLWEKSALADFDQYGNWHFVETDAALFAPFKLGEDDRDRGNGKSAETPTSPTPVTLGDCFSSNFALPSSKDLDLHLPDLTSFEYGPLEILENLELSSASSITGSNSSSVCQGQEEVDVWSSAQILDVGPVPAELKSWGNFYDKGLKQSRTPYISERGPSTFDAALSSQYARSQSDLLKESVGHLLHCGPVLKVFSP